MQKIFELIYDDESMAYVALPEDAIHLAAIYGNGVRIYAHGRLVWDAGKEEFHVSNAAHFKNIEAIIKERMQNPAG